VSGWSKTADERREALGADDVRLHDVRRTVRTRLSECGVDPDTAERVIGHKIKGVRGVYDRWEYLPQKRHALERWESRLAEILTSKASQ
jgi:integrase